MTILANDTIERSVISGVGPYPFNFRLFDAADLQVNACSTATPPVPTLLTYLTHYTVVSLAPAAGGTVTLTAAAAATYAGYTLDVRSNTQEIQPTSIRDQPRFLPEIHEDALDRLERQIQDQGRRLDNALQLPDNELNTGLLPTANVRKGTYLYFNATTGVPETALNLGLTVFSQGIFDGYLATSSAFVSAAASILGLQRGLNDSDAIETVAAALEAGTPTNLAFFGDSTMWGANVASLGVQVGTPPYAQCVAALNNYFGNAAAVAVNYALSGTTLAQMLAGTDGSGLTYAARLAATNSPVVFMNHGMNDAAGAGISTSAAVYRANLLTCIQQTRAAGKTLVFVTPHPGLTMGTFGSKARAETVSLFSNIMRDVAREHGVKLVDNNLWLSMLMNTQRTANGSQTNTNLPLSILPDGVHGNQATYYFTGNNLCDAITGGRIDTFTGPNQRITAVRGNTIATSQAYGPSTSSTTGGAVATGSSGVQSMRILFRVDQPGLDISLLHSIYEFGDSSTTLNLDGVQAGAFSTFGTKIAGFTAANFLQDVETTLIHNIAPGWHQLTITTTNGAIAVNGLRSRATDRPIQLGIGATADLSVRQTISPKIYIPSGSAGSFIAMTDYVVSRLCEPLELEWTGTLAKSSGLAICAYCGDPAGAATVERMLTFGLDASGFAGLWEATAPATYTATAFDAVDHSGGSHTYRVILTAANPGSVQMFVDDVSVGTIALTKPFFGGWLGAWKLTAGTILNFSNVSRVWHT